MSYKYKYKHCKAIECTYFVFSMIAASLLNARTLLSRLNARTKQSEQVQIFLQIFDLYL